MTETEVVDVGFHTIIVILKIGGPLMLVTLIIGFSISLLQALTQIQEMTLAFIPKMLATFAALLFGMPFFGRTMAAFTHEIFDRIIGLGS
jgi:flagellar biosynthetic protein FliQ